MDEIKALKRQVAQLQGAVTILFLLLFAAAGLRLLDLGLKNAVSGVRTSWMGDSLRYNTLTGRVLITGLAQGSVAAKLPEPILTVDSETVSWDLKELRKLKWRSEGGVEMPPPEPGSPVDALFVRLESSNFKR